jgi:biopolymer transport protein TolR
MGFSMNSGDDRGPVAEINVTPLVDVMLVLLVIFMVTAPFMENGIPIQLPKASTKAIGKDQSPVTMTLTKDSRIFLGREETTFARLIPTLQQLFRDRPRKEIFIRADGGLPYAFVAQSMAAVRQAGIDKIGLVTAPPEGNP